MWSARVFRSAARVVRQRGVLSSCLRSTAIDSPVYVSKDVLVASTFYRQPAILTATNPFRSRYFSADTSDGDEEQEAGEGEDQSSSEDDSEDESEAEEEVDAEKVAQENFEDLTESLMEEAFITRLATARDGDTEAYRKRMYSALRKQKREDKRDYGDELYDLVDGPEFSESEDEGEGGFTGQGSDEDEDSDDDWGIPDAGELLGVPLSEDEPLYDVRKLFEKEMYEVPNRDIPKMPEILTAEIPPPYEGATPFLNWEVNLVIVAGNDPHHPLNRKVRLWFKVSDLKREYQLTDEGVQRIRALCGDRYKPMPGKRGGDRIVLSTQQFPEREDNRRLLFSWTMQLVKEGRKAGTPDDPLLPLYEERERLRKAELERRAAFRASMDTTTVVAKSD